LKERLSATFSSRDEYHGLARQQSAFRHRTPEIREYVDYELIGRPPKIRCRTDFAAIEAEAADLAARAGELAGTLEGLTCPIMFLRAERGMQDEQDPLFDTEIVTEIVRRVPSMSWRTIADTNHYTVVNTERAAGQVAMALTELLDRSSGEAG
jgi:pimeloyl-ACP methyl ester carboxylesterase